MFEKFKARKEEKRTKKKSVVMGAFSALAFIFGICFIPSLCSLLFALVGVMLLPIPQLQTLLARVFPKAKLKGIVCGVLAVAAFACAPAATSDSASPVVDDVISSAIEQIDQGEDETPPPTIEQIEQVEVETPPPTDSEIPSTFTIHFLDVGQADAALVECDGHYMLIDGGNSEDSSLIYSYLKKQNISHLDYIVATHGHEDHVGGLSGALNYATVGTAFCSVDNYDSDAFRDFVKYLEKQNKAITVSKAGDTFNLGSAAVQIVVANGNATNPNDTSIILRIVYGDTAFLFTGDAKREAEQAALNSGYELESTVLKVGHHGGKDSTEYVFLRQVAPQYAVISVGEDNTYGHPTEDLLSRLRDADVKTYRTDLQGTIICVSDGTEVSFTVSKNADADTLAPPVEKEPVASPPIVPSVDTTTEEDDTSSSGGGTDYVGNKNSYKFHYSWCNSVKKMKETNKYYYTGTRDEMIAKGYDPCQNCNP